MSRAHQSAKSVELVCSFTGHRDGGIELVFLKYSPSLRSRQAKPLLGDSFYIFVAHTELARLILDRSIEESEFLPMEDSDASIHKQDLITA